MELKVFERISLLGILPKEGDFATLKIIRQLREDLSFSEEEHKDLNIQMVGEGLSWDQEKDKGKDIEIGDKAKEIISDALKQLDKQKKLPMQCLTLYEEFIGVE